MNQDLKQQNSRIIRFLKHYNNSVMEAKTPNLKKRLDKKGKLKKLIESQKNILREMTKSTEKYRCNVTASK